MFDLIEGIVSHPIPSLLVVLNLIVIESLLSVDNAAVLATMVRDLPRDQRSAALKYGILGAYLFRGLCLFFAVWLVHFWWLKPFGGLYLLYLVWSWLKGRSTPEEDDDYFDKPKSRLYRWAARFLGPFWSTVVLIEAMDIAFSIDNILAAVAFTDNLLLICAGVFIGILAMRFVAQGFVKLMEEYRFLETSAFVVLGFLGVKLLLSVFGHLYPGTVFGRLLDGHDADLVTSGLTVAVFFVPVLTSILFNIPAKVRDQEKAS
jgi:YkoY family integral membrane protein